MLKNNLLNPLLYAKWRHFLWCCLFLFTGFSSYGQPDPPTDLCPGTVDNPFIRIDFVQNIPTNCEPCIDPSPLLVDVEVDCNAGDDDDDDDDGGPIGNAYELDISDPVLISGAATANCPGAVYAVQYTVITDCGTECAVQYWTIQNDGPEIECPMGLYLDCGDEINDAYIEYWLGLTTATTECPLNLNPIQNTYSPNNFMTWGTCSARYQMVTFNVADDCGRPASCNAWISIFDFDKPEIIQPALDLISVCSGLTAGDFQSWLDSHGGAIIEDACSEVTWTTIPENPELPLACDEVEVTFVATDDCGNSTSTTATFKLIDCHPPIIIEQPMDMTVECSEDNAAEFQAWLADNGGTVAVDACGDVYWMTDPMTPELSDDCGNTGSVTVVFIAKDDCGNQAPTDPATFTIVDTTPPDAPAPPADLSLQCADDVPAPADLTATDVCDGDITVSPTAQVTPGDCANQFTMVRTWTFIDDCGNSSSVSQTINVDDTMPPDAPAPPADVSVQCADDVPAPVDLTATDNCDGDITVSPTAQITPGDCVNQYTMVRTWTFVDECGNTSSVSQTINVDDTTPPELSDIPEDKTVECFDFVDGEPIPGFTIMGTYQGNTYYVSDQEYLWTEADLDATSKGGYIVSITSQEEQDWIDEQIVALGVNPLIWIGLNDAETEGEFIWTSGEPTDYTNWNAATNEPNGGTTENYTHLGLFDGICLWNDKSNGGFSGLGFPYILEIPGVAVTASDNCGEVTITKSKEIIQSIAETLSGDQEVPPSGSMASGTVSGSVNITTGELNLDVSFEGLEGNTLFAHIHNGATGANGPVVVALPIAAGVTEGAFTFNTVFGPTELGDLTGGNFYVNIHTESVPSGELRAQLDVSACNGQVVCTWTATDECGNSTSASQITTVEDTQAPEFTFVPGDFTFEGCDVTEDVIIPIEGFTYLGTYEGRVYYFSDELFTWTDANADATDKGGHIVSITSQEEQDWIDEQIALFGIADPRFWIGFNDALSEGNFVWTSGEPTDYTNWNTASNEPNGGIFENYAHIGLFDAVCLWNDSDNDAFGSGYQYILELSEVVAAAQDNCGGEVTVTFSDDTVENDCETIVTRTFTAVDACGNASTATQTITAIDTTAPDAPAPPADVNVQCADDVPAPVDLTATDNCDGDITVSPTAQVTPGDCANQFTMVRTWTFVDECGNTSSVSQTINVDDTMAPDAPAPPADVNVQCADDVPAPVDLTATDNCDGDITVSPTAQVTPGDCANQFTMVRTWTFVDGCGNTSSVSQTINVDDTTAPDAPAPPADVNVQCAADVPAPVDLTANDNCDGDITVSPTSSVTPGDCANQFTMVRTWTFVDECGNTSSVSQTINVDDTMPPDAPAPPADVNVQCAADVPAPVDLTANDNCDGDITVSPTIEITAGDCANQFTEVRTWTFVDECGNTSSVSQTINVDDTMAPDAPAPPADVNVQCADDVPAPVDLTANDNCDGDITVSPTIEITAGDCANQFTEVRTWTFVDGCGNTSSVSQTINVDDTTAPDAPAPPADVNVQCAADVPDAVDLTANDNCDGDITVSPTIEITAGDCANQFTEVRTWTFVDGCGNTSSVSQTINVDDTTAPDAPAPPADVNVQCAADVPAPVDLTANDNCDGDITVSPTSSVTPGDCANQFTMVRTWTFVDECGNTSSVSQTINVDDTMAPDAPAPPADVDVQCASDVPAPVDLTANDNCDGDITVSPTAHVTPGDCANQFTMVRTWTFVDECGNTSSVSQTINVDDTMPPDAPAPPADVDVQCASDVPAPVDLTATDNCDGDITVSPTAHVTPGDCANQFTMIRTWTFVDECGNTSSVSQTINVDDTMAPDAPAAPADVTVQCADDVPPPVDLTAQDNCDGPITDSPISKIEPENPVCPNQYQVIRIWTFVDQCGNESSVTQVITVHDDTAPEFTSVPADGAVECLDDVVFGTPEAEDNCGVVAITSEDETVLSVEGGFSGGQEVPPSGSNGSGTVSGSYNPGTGNLSIDVSYSGLTGNTVAAHIHNAPAGSNGGVIFPLPITTGNTSGSFSFSVDLDVAQAAELEAGNYYINIHTDAVPSGEIRAQVFVKPCVGSSTRIWTATDDCGNTATASQTITFEDTQAPVASNVPADITISCSDPVVFGDAPSWTDNCDDDVFSSFEDFEEDADCPFVKVHIRAWTAIDDCGNFATVKQRIYVEDVTPPVFTYVPPVLDIDCQLPPFPTETPVAEDDCGGPVTLTFEDLPPNGSICDQGAAYIRRYTAMDECGNSSTADVIAWINADQGAPVFTFVPVDLTFYCETPFEIPMATAEDDCGPVEITFDDVIIGTTVNCGNGYGYDIERTWKATDVCGNMTTAVTLAWVKPGAGPGNQAFNNDDDGNKELGRSTSFTELDIPLSVEINPNPVREQLNLSYTVGKEQFVTIRVFSILGKEIYRAEEVAATGTNTLIIPADRFVTGTYLVTVESESGELKTKKFIKQ